MAAALLLSACGEERIAAPQPKQRAAAFIDAATPIRPEVAAFYKERQYRPLWFSGERLKPEADALVAALAGAGQHGLDPAGYGVANLRAARAAVASGTTPSARARIELLLSQAFADYVIDLRQPAEEPDIFYVDESLKPRRLTRRDVLDSAAAAPSLGRHLAAVQKMNPLYESLRRADAAERAKGLSPEQDRLVRANLERARALPADPGERFIIVDAAGARLWLFEGGQAVDSMRVVVGKASQKTPMMAGLIRFAVQNPYWNIPPDLVPSRVARHVLRQGTGFLAREGLQVLSDWTPEAQPVNASAVHWGAVAAGSRKLRVRQLPGPGNIMGAVKFMMPNKLGIYLHDTPDRALFAKAQRTESSGCVRVEDAARLQRWLFRGAPPALSGEPEQRVDLPEPVPVYITYLTAAPAEGGIAFQRDVYGRDRQMLAALERARPPRA